MQNSHKRPPFNHANPGDQPPNLLYRRLEEALQQGREVWIRTVGGGFAGIPIYLDAEFVEIVSVYVPDEEELLEPILDLVEELDDDEETYHRTVWLIRISEISAASYSTASWSRKSFEQLLNRDEESQEEESNEDSA